jgi:hypothetical protein
MQRLWEEFQTTPAEFTRKFNLGSRTMTAINATYVIRRLTEVFGPCGVGWKFCVESESYVDGHMLKSGDCTKIHVIKGHISYSRRVVDDNSEIGDFTSVWYHTSPQFGQTTFVGENKHGTFTDEEAPKKSITDCLTKCAVMLGVGADVHLGLYDDNKYVNARHKEQRDSETTVWYHTPEGPTKRMGKAREATPQVETSPLSAVVTAAQEPRLHHHMNPGEQKKDKSTFPNTNEFVTQGEAANFEKSFRQACPKTMSSAEASLQAHEWLAAMKFTDENGDPTAKRIPAGEFQVVKQAAVAFAKNL